MASETVLLMKRADEAKSLEELEEIAKESKELVRAQPSKAPMLATLFCYLRLRFEVDALKERVKALEEKQ